MSSESLAFSVHTKLIEPCIVKYLSPPTSIAIIRVARSHYRLVWAALSFVTRLPKPVDTPCVIQVIRVSGTIKKAEGEAIKRAREEVIRARAGVEEAEGKDDEMDLFERFGLTRKRVYGEEDLGEVEGIEDDDEINEDDEMEDDDGG